MFLQGLARPTPEYHSFDSEQAGGQVTTLAPQFDDTIFLHTSVVSSEVQSEGMFFWVKTVTNLEFNCPNCAGINIARPVVDVEILDSPRGEDLIPSLQLSELAESDIWASEGAPSRTQEAGSKSTPRVRRRVKSEVVPGNREFHPTDS